jgi:hypothetical protein
MDVYSKMFMNITQHYNSTNWRKLVNCVKSETPVLDQPTWKALTSLSTRYWLFVEKNPEMSESDRHMLYFLIGMDRIGKLMATFPRCSDEDFRSLQEQLLPLINEVLSNEQKS